MHWLLGSATRRLGWDRNPIRRPVDRLQTILTVTMLVMVLAVAPLTAWLAAARAHDDGRRAEHRERAAYRLVAATVVYTGDVRATGAGKFIGETIRLRWPDRQGSARTGTIDVDHRVRAGAKVPVWVDESGALTHRPRAPGQTRSATAWAAIAGVTGVVIPAVGGYLIARRRLDRHRYRRWENDWARIAPLWTRRAG
jgi:hypothetical protein